MKRTSKYNLGYFENGDFTSSDIEMQRFETLDAQLYSLFAIMGNGILSGWDIIESSGLTIAVTTGSGHVAFVAVNSIENNYVELVPNTDNYIYAQLTATSYWDQSTIFASYLSEDVEDQSLLLGIVTTDDVSITNIDTSMRQELGFIALIKEIVAEHRHIGGVSNPPPINLSSEVQGVLNQENLPELDASIIKAGILDVNRIPELSHITNLTDQGSLTHAQIESLLETLKISEKGNMGEVALTNLLQLVISLKHIYPNIDDYLVNCITIIPGITPDSYIDLVNTTATVDTRTYAEGGEHTITGITFGGTRLYTKIWDTADDYSGATFSNTMLDSNSVVLTTTTNEKVIDNFSAITNWSIVTEDTSTLQATVEADTTKKVTTPQSAKIFINGNEIEMILLAKKEFSPQDWSDYKYLKFYIYTDSVQHGDIFFYFIDGDYGVQNSYVKVLDRNKPTINDDTLQNGWQEVTIDISGFERASINLFAFMLSTQDGWDTSKSFYFNVDDISVSTGNLFQDNGYTRMIYGNDFPYNFHALRWDANLPSGTVLQARARFANTIADLSTAIWTDYITVSGDDFGLSDDDFYKYIEIEMFLSASTDNISSPYVNSVYLDYYASDTTNNFTIDTQDEWEEGARFNIDTTTSPGSIVVGNLTDIGTYEYATDGSVSILNNNFSEKNYIVGTALPKSTNQCLAMAQSKFGLITAIDRGNNGNMWLADVDNDRIVEIDKSGNLVRGFYGSFLAEPIDVYGTEEAGPGSNVYLSNAFSTEFDTSAVTTATTNTSSTTMTYDLSVLHSIYNPDEGMLYVIFNKTLENIYESASFNIEKMYLKVGTHIFRTTDSNVSLLGVNEDKYNLWIDLYKNKTEREKETGKHIRQFKFSSHALRIELSQSEQIALNYLVRTNYPRVAISTPKANGIQDASFVAEFIYYNVEIGNGTTDSYAKVIIDGTTTHTIYTSTLSLSGLANGAHTIRIELYDSDDNPYTNIGATAETSFIVETNSSYSYPVLYVESPCPNQVFSTDTIEIQIATKNFPIIPSGQHLKYQIDSDAIEEYNSDVPITISGLLPGEHTFRAYLVDENGNDLGYTYGTVEVNFIIGLNPDAVTKLYYAKDFVKDITLKSSNLKGNVSVDIANIVMCNIFSPIDLQVIPYQTSSNTNSIPSILIGKLRSPSFNEYLAGEANQTEFENRLYNAAITNTITPKRTLNESLSSISTQDLVFKDKYMDGHSVIQLDLEGNVMFSNNAGIFATSRSESKNILGGVKKVGQNELLIGDSKNQRAIITYTDLTTKNSKVTWQYDSDRYIVDFVQYPQEDIEISINDGSIDEPNQYIVRGTTITWTNNSSAPIEIYSGTTDYDTFYADPDLSQYGKVFKSETLNIGESYTFRFETNGEFDWFVYPSILTGTITVTENRISSNDMFYLLESDGLESPYTSRAIKIDAYGNVLWSMGENYLVKPRDIRAISGGKVIIST